METGTYIKVKNILSDENIGELKKIAEKKLTDEKSSPFYIAKEKGMGRTIIERYRKAGALKAISKCSNILEREIGKEWLVLENKVLLRRTWPMSKSRSERLESNASNLTWHQDTNNKHQGKAMIVIMCSLDGNFGIDKPGLQIINANTNKFKGIYGYEGHKVAHLETEIMKEYGVLKIEAPTLDKGDGIIFNGLTFHRTFSNQEMDKTRDALLIRIIKPSDINNFQMGNHTIIKVK